MTETQQTPPAEGGGTEMTQFNTLRHGVLSRYTFLPWEDADEYRALLTARMLTVLLRLKELRKQKSRHPGIEFRVHDGARRANDAGCA